MSEQKNSADNQRLIDTVVFGIIGGMVSSAIYLVLERIFFTNCQK